MNQRFDFSFVVPSRGEIDGVRKFLDSLERTTSQKDRLEVLFAIDEGKTDIVKYVNNRKYNFRIVFFERPKTKDFVKDYYNWLADRTLGDNIIPFNDDAWMRTNDWDNKIRNRISEFNTSVYLLDIPDTARIKYGNSFPCFPMISRRGMNTVGGLFTNLVRMYPADKIIYDVYSFIGHVIKVNNVLIEHEHISDYTGQKKELLEILNEDRKQSSSFDISEYVLRLSKVCAAESMKQSKIRRILNIIKE